MAGFRSIHIILILSLWITAYDISDAVAQDTSKPATGSSSTATNPVPSSEPVVTEDKVDVQPGISDEQIEARLTEILQATQWFEDLNIDVQKGVVFLQGFCDTSGHRDQAVRIASRVEDTVVVVNQLQLIEPAIFDWTPAYKEMRLMLIEVIRSVPVFILALIMTFLLYFFCNALQYFARLTIGRQIDNELLRDIFLRSVWFLSLMFGIYVILRVTGMTGIATTVIGTTGAIGIVLGIAFRDIGENFLSSILISVQRPFQIGDAIEVSGIKGIVQGVTLRGTQLMTFEGYQTQIPNSVVYKNILTNLSGSGRQRIDVLLGVGYNDSLTRAQKIIMATLTEHEAILKEPEPMVLIENLATSTVNIRIYAWVDTIKFSLLKVKSALIRQMKAKLQEAGVEFPDEAREIIFPKGIPISYATPENGSTSSRPSQALPDASSQDDIHSGHTIDLSSEEDAIKQEASNRQIKTNENLMSSKDPPKQSS